MEQNETNNEANPQTTDKPRHQTASTPKSCPAWKRC